MRTLNGLIQSRERIVGVVENAIGDALLETGGAAVDDNDRLSEVEAEIASLRNQFSELQKRRTRREVDALGYNDESCEIQNRLDDLFAEYDSIIEQRGAAMLDKAVQELFAEFFSAASAQATFDKQVFTRLVKSVRILGKDNIVFELRDGTQIKGDTAMGKAA